MDANISNYGLIMSEPPEKFGIANDQDDLHTKARKISVESETSQKDTTSVSSSASSASVAGSLSQYLPNSLQKRGGLGYSGIGRNEAKDSASDSEKSVPFKLKGQTAYATLQNDQDFQDLECNGDDSSNLSGHSHSVSSVYPSGSANATPVKHNSHQRKISQDWVVFDDAPTKRLSESSPSPVSISSLPMPPEIPQRKGWQTGSTCSPARSLDLLSMDNDSLTEHLYRVSPIPHNNTQSAVPPIPDRLMSPQKKFDQTPASTGSTPKSFEIRLPPPHAPNMSSRRSLQMTVPGGGAVPHLTGPPVPPRKDMEKVADTPLKLTTSDKKEHSVGNWIQFEETTDGGFTNPTNTFFIYCVNTSSSSAVESDQVKKVDDNVWRRPTSTSPNGSLRSSKKKKGGYQHLSDTDDEKEKPSQQSETNKVTIQVTDMSPAKPLSHWAPIPNDDHAGSSGNVSTHNSLMDEPTQDDSGLDDDFGDNVNRLSADVNNLRGFNRADKGSQNNLVDFSESAEQLESAACGSTSSGEGDLETVFDMTAQGDTLKRKRKKNQNELASNATPTFNIGTDNISTASAADLANEFDPMAPVKPSDVSTSNLAPTNPFWSPSPLGDSISVSSSVSDTNPFEKVQFQSTTATPLQTTGPLAKSVGGIPILPPPPGASKSRNQSGSWRSRTRESSVSSPLAVTQTEPSDKSISSPVLVDSDLSNSVFVTPVKSPQTTFANELIQDTTEETSKGIDVPDGVPTVSNPNAAVNTDNISTASTSKQDNNILETTLSILDVFSKPDPEPGPIEIESADIKTYHAMQVDGSFPELRDDSLESLEKFQKAVSVESPAEVHDISVLEKKKTSFSDYDLVPKAKEWNMLMRFPREKRMMSSRKWVNIHVRLDNSNVKQPTLQLYHNSHTTDPFYFVSLARHDWQISDPVRQARFYPSGSLEETDMEANKRKVHTVKLLHVHYKEKYAFLSKQDQLLMKTPSGFRHSLKGKQGTKLGTENYMDLLSMIFAVREAAFIANRLLPRSGNGDGTEALPPLMNYHSRDEIIFDIRDQFRGAVGVDGEIKACCVAVHVFVTAFLSGDPVATVTFNDQKVEGSEVVKREDIMPSSNDRWVEMGDVSLHRCSASRGYDAKTASVIFRPPDACRFELMRFRCPFSETELPLSIRPSITITGARVTLRCVLRSGADNTSNKDSLTQIPCEDISIRFPIPHNWSPAFRRPGRFRIKSIHSKRIVKRPPGPTLGQSRGVVATNAVLEASVGTAKYEVAYGAIVWRIGRFPEKNATSQNAPQILSCKLELSSDRDLPDPSDVKFRTCDVEYTMPSSTASSACVRSVNLPRNERAEKFACYGAQYMYKVDVGVTHERDEVNSDKPSCALQ